MCLSLCLASCSVKKNTAGSRFWQSFTTRYNVYFNGSEAYKEGCLAKEQGNKDDYTETLHLFTVANENAKTLGSSNFETAITKCQKAIQLHSIKRRPAVNANRTRTAKMRAYLSRKEFNPFLKNAWILMGKSQFQKGDFLEAASTFSYITRLYAPEPEVAAEARLWMARCYAQLDWLYDADDALDRVKRDTLPPRLRNEHNATLADIMLRRKQYAEAAPLVEAVAKKEKRKMQKARLYFLLGQVHTHIGNDLKAYKAYQKCIKQSPPYEMAFNARIRQTEVLSGNKGMGKKMIGRLSRMARSTNNKEYLDQVFYAMGNIYLAQNDTAKAIGAYEQGRAKSTRNGIDKGVLLLRLGQLYWEKGRYDLAQKCYGEAVGLLDKSRDGYEEASKRSKVLDELVPHTSAVYLQDSLQLLSTMSEVDRNAAIDRVIAEVIRQEKLAREASADSAAEARAQENGAQGTQNQTQNKAQTNNGDKTWYFYNPMLVMQGKQDFQKHWGKRKLEDNWRRNNRSVVNLADDSGPIDYEKQDSIEAAQARQDSIDLAQEKEQKELAPEDDPHKREYYLKQIPFTPEAKAASDAVIMEGLYNAGIIEKDKLEDFPLASKTLTRLCTQYPKYEKNDDTYYQLYLLYSRWGKTAEAQRAKQQLASLFPQSAQAKLITDPDYERFARYGKEIEDSLYTATYEAYRRHDAATVEANYAISEKKFPNGANRPKFMLVYALSRLGKIDGKTLAAELKELVKKYPESDVSEMAGMIVNGLEAGRQIGTGSFDIGSLWQRRSEASTQLADSIGKDTKLSDERDVPFVFLVAYPTDSIDDDKLLYALAHFNFTGFVVRNFDMQKVAEPGLTQFRVSGFNNFDEAHAYAQKIYADSALVPMLKKARVVLISSRNLPLLGSRFSFDDYSKFYDKTFAPLKTEPEPLDMNQGPIEQHYEDEYTPEELEKQNNQDEQPVNTDDGGEWYPAE